MEGIIQIAIYFVIPIIIFIGIQIDLFRSEEKRGTIKRRIQFGFTYLALFLYIIGLLTSISFQIMLVIVYLLMIIVWVWRKLDMKL